MQREQINDKLFNLARRQLRSAHMDICQISW